MSTLILQRIATIGSAFPLGPFFAALWAHRAASFAPPQPYGRLAAFVQAEFAYYWTHFAS